MERNSFIFYKSFYEAIKELDKETQTEIYNAILSYQFENIAVELSGVAKAIFTLIKPQLDANNTKFENGCKGAEYGKMGGRPKKEKPQNNPKETPKKPQENPEETPNVNENVNVNDNVNVTATAVIESDSCADGSLQSDSCVDEVANSNSEMLQFDSCVDGIVKFYNANIGLITPYEFEILNSYRADFSDDVIIYALQLQVENKASGISYAKAILNNWKKSNIKTLLEAEKENKSRKTSGKKEGTSNSYHSDTSGQYGDLSKFYVN